MLAFCGCCRRRGSRKTTLARCLTFEMQHRSSMAPCGEMESRSTLKIR
jgi:hypothetical protein